MQTTIVLCLLGYLAGSIPTGKILGTFKGIDIQKQGSGNIGFANSVRVLGWQLGIVVLIVDVLKGFMPVFVAKMFGLNENVLLLVGITPILGHAYPIWLNFRGGKSIATGFGVTLAISPLLAACGIATYIVMFSIYRKSAISSLASAWALPISCILIEPRLSIYFIALAMFATYTHRNNIKVMYADLRKA